MEQAIKIRVAELLAESPALVAGVHVDILPQSPTYPAVCVRLIAEESLYTLDGTVRMCRALVQVDAFAKERSGQDPYADATELAQRINGTEASGAGLSGFRGTVNGPESPGADFRILGTFREDRRRQYDPDAVRVVTVQQDYRCFYRPD